MSQLIKIVYVGKKPTAYDNVAKSGKVWNGNGDVQEVTEDQAKQLLKFHDQWQLADEADREAVDAPTTVAVKDEEGNDVQVDAAVLGKPLEKMTKPELVALALARWGQQLDVNKAKKLLIDAIEEFERDLEPVATVG
jgi:cytochrome c peroxidase